jgi:hypothetical protein
MMRWRSLPIICALAAAGCDTTDPAEEIAGALRVDVAAQDQEGIAGLYWMGPAKVLSWPRRLGAVQVYTVKAESACNKGELECRPCSKLQSCAGAPAAVPPLPQVADQDVVVLPLPPLPAGGGFLIHAPDLAICAGLPATSGVVATTPAAKPTTWGRIALVTTWPHDAKLMDHPPPPPTTAHFALRAATVSCKGPPENPDLPPYTVSVIWRGFLRLEGQRAGLETKKVYDDDDDDDDDEGN